MYSRQSPCSVLGIVTVLYRSYCACYGKSANQMLLKCQMLLQV